MRYEMTTATTIHLVGYPSDAELERIGQPAFEWRSVTALNPSHFAVHSYNQAISVLTQQRCITRSLLQ
jgi:hypothetical protein